jgi:protein-disulfide isomerase
MKDLQPMRKRRRFPYRVLLPSALAATLLAEPVAQAAPMTSGGRELSRSQADGMVWLIDENLPDDPGLPVLENSQGDVTLVEFFDYPCPYCRTMAPASAALIASDSKSRVVMKEYPISHRQSIVAAKVALVAATDGKYVACHDAMFAAKSLFDVSKVLSVAQLVGLDPARLTQEMDAPEIATELQINIALEKALDSRGTPTFLVDGYIAASAVADAGAGIATNGTPGGVSACATCHGGHGEGNADAGFPRLSGLSPRYMREQLAAFANGQRDNPIMTPVAKALRKL